MAHIDADLTHVVAAQSWNSGGGIELDIIEFDGGLTLVVSDELISVYPSAEAWIRSCLA
ncbi:MAG: hypothetical protein DK306_001869 [Chloroflexi bacterium]|jgi:hypothetical protein|nr:MAG: hypothetical protein DK306_001869 [Chloroflexota bacterium]